MLNALGYATLVLGLGTPTRGIEPGDDSKWKFESRRAIKGLVDLPPLCVVDVNDPTSEGWQITGHVAATIIAARDDFGRALRRQGWKNDLSIPISGRNHHAEISVWQKRNRRLLLMMWEEGVGRSGFSLGEETAKQESAPGDVRSAPSKATPH